MKTQWTVTFNSHEELFGEDRQGATRFAIGVQRSLPNAVVWLVGLGTMFREQHDAATLVENDANWAHYFEARGV